MIEERSTYQNVDTLNTFPIKKTLCRWGVGFYGQPKSDKSGKTKPDFFYLFRKSNILTIIFLLCIMTYLNL